jgi:hypothetical protein
MPDQGEFSASFLDFLEEWNAHQGFVTPSLHRKMAGWLEEMWRNKRRELVLLAFRDSGKSTLTGLFCAWTLRCWPDCRVLTVAADQHLAKKMVRTVKRVLETHPACQGMKPERAELWGADAFTINRPRVGRDPSMAAKGIAANLTGSHADLVICDDVEVPNTSNTAQKRRDLRLRLAEIAYVLSPGGTQLYIGTPHARQSIYAAFGQHDGAEEEDDEEGPFLAGFERLECPIYDQQGGSVWPERFSEETIERIRRRSGPLKFMSQMLLVPQPLEAGCLEAERLRVYNEEMEIRSAGGAVEHRLFGRRLRTVRLWWDPALGRTRDPDRASQRNRDESVAAVVGEDGHGDYFIHRLLSIVVDPAGRETPVLQQCTQIIDLVRALSIPIVHVEANGLGAFLADQMQAALHKVGVRASVRREISNRPKRDRILDAFVPALFGARLYAHEMALRGPLQTQMREWHPARQRGGDDALDAAAGAILACPRPHPPDRSGFYRAITRAPAAFDP